MAKRVDGFKELSQFEKMIKEKYGKKGVEIYRLIDGKKNVQRIMNEAGVNEKTIVRFLRFLEDRGIIRLEKDKVPRIKLR